MLTIASRLDAMQRLGRAMADPTRSRILECLLRGPSNPADLARSLDLTPSNVSNHLSCLRGCGLVLVTPHGRRATYEIADPHLTRALASLVEVVVAVDDGLECAGADCAVPLCCPRSTQDVTSFFAIDSAGPSSDSGAVAAARAPVQAPGSTMAVRP